VKFGEARYDGVLIEVDDAAHTPVWMATTADRVGQKGCAIFAPTSKESSTSQNRAATHACVAAGLGFS
jgi:hypothetical protein